MRLIQYLDEGRLRTALGRPLRNPLIQEEAGNVQRPIAAL